MSFTPAVREVVEFAKHIPGFRDLSQHDQVTLLKAGTFEVSDSFCSLVLFYFFPSTGVLNSGPPFFLLWTLGRVHGVAWCLGWEGASAC